MRPDLGQAPGRGGFMCRIRMTFPCAYPDRRPGRRPGLPTRPDQNLARRELRSKRMGAEKSGVGAVSIRRREAVGLGQGDITNQAHLNNRDRASANCPVARERRAGVANDSWTLRACCVKASLLSNKMGTHRWLLVPAS